MSTHVYHVLLTQSLIVQLKQAEHVFRKGSKVIDIPKSPTWRESSSSSTYVSYSNLKVLDARSFSNDSESFLSDTKEVLGEIHCDAVEELVSSTDYLRLQRPHRILPLSKISKQEIGGSSKLCDNPLFDYASREELLDRSIAKQTNHNTIIDSSKCTNITPRISSLQAPQLLSTSSHHKDPPESLPSTPKSYHSTQYQVGKHRMWDQNSHSSSDQFSPQFSSPATSVGTYTSCQSKASINDSSPTNSPSKDSLLRKMKNPHHLRLDLHALRRRMPCKGSFAFPEIDSPTDPETISTTSSAYSQDNTRGLSAQIPQLSTFSPTLRSAEMNRSIAPCSIANIDSKYVGVAL